MAVRLTKGKDTVVLSNEIMIRAYEQAGYTKVEIPPKKRPVQKK